jgi:predicted nucleic acid-binding protein
MRMVADTNTFLAVAMNQPQRPLLIRLTRGHDLVAPAVLPYEIGNALSALVRRKAVTLGQVSAIWQAVDRIPVGLVTIDVRAATLLAGRLGIFAYDAYFLQCALEGRVPLLTLDSGMKRVAVALKIPVVEVP